MATYKRGYEPSAIGTSSIAAQGLTFTPNKNDFTANDSTIPVVHLVQPGQVITGFVIGGRATTAGTAAQARMGAYVTNAAGTTEGALVVGDVLTAVTTSTTVQYHSTGVLSIDLSAYVGQYIKVAKGSDGGQFRPANKSGGVSGDFNSAPTSFPNPFGSATNASSLIPMWMIIEDVAAPVIQSVNGGAAVKIGATVAVTVTGFSKAITKGTIDGVPLAAASATSITLGALSGATSIPRPGAARTLVLSSADDTETASAAITISLPDGIASQEILAGFNSGEANSIVYNFSPAMEAGRIILYSPGSPAVGETPSTATVVLSNAGCETDVTGAQTMYDFNPSTKAVKSFVLTTGDASDTTPDAFSFTPVTGATRSQTYESSEVTVSGINAASAVTITGGEYAIDTGSGYGSWTSSARTIANGNKIKVRRAASASYSTQVTATLTIGGVSATFSITTMADPNPPEPSSGRSLVRSVSKALQRSITH